MGEQSAKAGGQFGIVLGDPFMSNMTASIPGAIGYPVQYPASMNTAADTTIGRTDIVKRLIKQATACPDQRFALVGYSEGAIVIHADIVPKIIAIVLYGDPTITSPVAVEKMPDTLYRLLRENCSEGDHTCDTSKGCPSDHARHLDYTKQAWIDRGVNFIFAEFKSTPVRAGTSGTLSL
jgi:cutinase